jgi:sugar phosphate isomerase/epimerase
LEKARNSKGSRRKQVNVNRHELALGVTTYGYLYHRTLDESLGAIAAAGFTLVELAVAPPHMYVPATGLLERRRLQRRLVQLDLTCVSVSPAELNLISPNLALRDISFAQYVDCVRFAHDLEVSCVIVVPGRLSSLIPTPLSDAVALLKDQIDRLLPHARQLGVQLALETSPYGFLETGREVAELVTEFDDRYLGIAFDCANVFASQEVDVGVREVGDRLVIAHLSDTWKQRFAHTSIGRGEVDFESYAQALLGIEFRGPTIYELMDGEDPDPRIRQDRDLLAQWGWVATKRLPAVGDLEH